MSEKQLLFTVGKEHITQWCQLNNVSAPDVIESNDPSLFGTCAYYRNNEIYIDVESCATYGHFGRQYSWPGYVVDRTPYGVLAHELGHHVDVAHGAAGGLYGTKLRVESREQQLTGYCDNDNEWFAEMFRLFVTNPDLLRVLRPKTWSFMHDTWPNDAETRLWRVVLEGAARQMRAADNKIAAVRNVSTPRMRKITV